MKEKAKTLPKRTPGRAVFKHARAYRGVYLMATPVLVAALIFYYLPMFGIRYAFFTYKGINDPIFVGLKHFTKMFSMPGFLESVQQYTSTKYYKADFEYRCCGDHFRTVK